MFRAPCFCHVGYPLPLRMMDLADKSEEDLRPSANAPLDFGERGLLLVFRADNLWICCERTSDKPSEYIGIKVSPARVDTILGQVFVENLI